MKRNQRQLTKILKEIAKEQLISIRVQSDDWIIIMNDGSYDMLIYGYKFPNNNAAIEHVCNDKSGLSVVLKEKGIPTVPHIYFESPQNNSYADPEKDRQLRSALHKKWGYVVVKPNEGTGGNDVYKATDIDNIEKACEAVFLSNRSCAISPFREIEHEYRVIVLNHKVRLVFEKIRSFVIGNGRNTVRELIQQQNRLFPIEKITVPNIVIPDGEKYTFQWKHNLGQGGNAVIITDIPLKEELSNIATLVTKALNANFVSVDIIYSSCGYEVLEVNSGVMMEHFAKSSVENYEIAKNIYRDAVNSYFSSLHPHYQYERHPKKRFVLPILENIAANNNIDVIKDLETGAFDIFTFSNKKSFVAKDYPFNINISGSARLCKNKGACSYFLKKLGYSVPLEKYFIKKDDIWETIKEISSWLKNPLFHLGFSYPMIIKPNSLSQGTGVHRIDNYDEGIISLKMIQDIPDRVFLLQQYVPGHDCRIVVHRGKIIQAYERIPFSIEGNGLDTVEELLKKKYNQFIKANRDKYVDITDTRIMKKIKKRGFDLSSVVETGVVIELQDVCNLSLGGYAEDIENNLSEYLKNVSIAVAKNLNLSLCGIDMRIKDLQSEKYSIIEVNSAPGLDNYLYSGEEREEYLNGLYAKILTEIPDES